MKTGLEKTKKNLLEEERKLQERLSVDFMHSYEWDYTSDLYKVKFKVRYVDYLLSRDVVLERKATAAELLACVKEDVFTSRVEKSTNQGANRASLLRIEALKELHSYLELFLI